MNKFGWSLLLASAFTFGQGTQPPQTARPTVSVQTVQHSQRAMATAPTDVDMYCSGYITTDRVPENHYIVGGQNSPDQSRYAGASDAVFIYGSSLKEGDKLQIIRRVRDPNHYEFFKGQRAEISKIGQPYFEVGIVRVVHVERNVTVAVPELNCSDIVVGDLAIPFAEREKPSFRNVKLDRYVPATGKTTGRIVMAYEFDGLLGANRKVYLNIGADKGLKAGDYLRATRSYDYKYHDPVDGLSAKAVTYDETQLKPPKAPRGVQKEFPRLTLGDMIVLHVHPRSATAMILTSYEDIHVGDGVEVMDTSDAPPVSPSSAITPSQTESNTVSGNAGAPNPPTIACSASPNTVRAGDRATISCDVASADNRPVTVRFSSNSGRLSTTGNRAVLDTSQAGPGPVSVRATALDDRDMSASTVTNVNVEAPPQPPAGASKLNELEFKPNSAYVDNRAKAMLDDIALRMQQDSNSMLFLSSGSDANEAPRLATERAQNTMAYLTQSKGIDRRRILAKPGTRKTHTVEVWAIPPGASMPQQ